MKTLRRQGKGKIIKKISSKRRRNLKLIRTSQENCYVAAEKNRRRFACMET